MPQRRWFSVRQVVFASPCGPPAAVAVRLSLAEVAALKMGVPIIDGDVLSVGKVPPSDVAEAWLRGSWPHQRRPMVFPVVVEV